MSANHSPIPSSRLGLVDELLLASGWACDADGWLAPKHFRHDLAQEVGAGHVSRSIAIAAQVQHDEAILQAVAKAKGQA